MAADHFSVWDSIGSWCRCAMHRSILVLAAERTTIAHPRRRSWRSPLPGAVAPAVAASRTFPGRWAVFPRRQRRLGGAGVLRFTRHRCTGSVVAAHRSHRRVQMVRSRMLGFVKLAGVRDGASDAVGCVTSRFVRHSAAHTTLGCWRSSVMSDCNCCGSGNTPTRSLDEQEIVRQVACGAAGRAIRWRGRAGSGPRQRYPEHDVAHGAQRGRPRGPRGWGRTGRRSGSHRRPVRRS